MYKILFMTKYLNRTGESNIDCYEILANYIEVLFFKSNKIYRYSYLSASKEAVEVMKKLALSGHGLNSFINKYAKFKYEKNN